MTVLQCLNNFKLLLKLHFVDEVVETVSLWASHEAHKDAFSKSVTAEIKFSTVAS